jgi:hypothetical protein
MSQQFFLTLVSTTIFVSMEEFGLPSRAQGGLSKKDSDIRGFRLVDRDNYAVPETEDIWRNQPERTDEDIAVLLEWNTPRDFIQMSRQGADDVIIRVRPAKTESIKVR